MIPNAIESRFVPWVGLMPNKQGCITDNQRAMLQKPIPSYCGNAITVEYYLSVYHKHDAWNEFGEGMLLKIPI